MTIDIYPIELDRLHQMLTAQRQLDARVGRRHDGAEPDAMIIRGLVRAVRHELTELEDSTSWKWWRPTNYQPLDLQNIKVEVVDMLHFVLSILLELKAGAPAVCETLYAFHVGNDEEDAWEQMFTHLRNRTIAVINKGEAGSEQWLTDLYAMVEEMHDDTYRICKVATRDGLVDRLPAINICGSMLRHLVQMALMLDLTADDFVGAYLAKMQMNHQRQDSGYVVKDENDSRHI